MASPARLSTFVKTDYMRELPTKFESAAIKAGYRSDAREVLCINREHASLVAYYNDPEGTLDELDAKEVILALEGADRVLNKSNPLEMLLWQFFKKYLDEQENRNWLGNKPGFIALMQSYGLMDCSECSSERTSRVAQTALKIKTPYEALIKEYIGHRSSESDQVVIACLPHALELISLYNNFAGEIPKMPEREVRVCFKEVFLHLKIGFDLQGTFRKAFQTQLPLLQTKFKKIDASQYQSLLKIAKGSVGGLRMEARHKQVSSRSILYLVSGKALRGKEWLAAATVLGLLVSYPLIIKPIHQASRHMFGPKLKPTIAK
jgi:hypothetical protein